MKKIIIIFLAIIFMCIPKVNATNENEISTEDIIDSQMQELNIQDFIKKGNEYSEEFLDDFNVGDLLESSISGDIDNQKIINKIIDVFVKEFKDTFKILGSIIVIIIIHSVLKSISESLENKSIATMCYYVQYILIVTLIMTNFSDIINMSRNAIQNMVGFSQTLIPILMTLLLTTGSIASANLIEPLILFLINFISNIFEVFIIPIVLVSTAISIVSKISDKIQINKISKFMKSGTTWFMAVILTLFVSIISIDGSLTSSVDGITAKTTKAAVSNLIPVVGKILGDSIDTVIGCSNILKNAVGVVGVIIIIGICATPIIKLTILTISYYLFAALCEPIADNKIISLLEEMGGTFKMLLAIMCSISVMLVIGTTLVIKISNSGMMYR